MKDWVVGPHGWNDNRLWDALYENGNIVKLDPNGLPDEDGKPIGHTTHNMFVKCKKTKEMYLITVRQKSKIDLKSFAVALGAKELRLCKDREDYLGSTRGCITALALFYDEGWNVKWVVETELMAMPEWVLCAGCQDPLQHDQHNLTTVRTLVPGDKGKLKSIIPWHWEHRIEVEGCNTGGILAIKFDGTKAKKDSPVHNIKVVASKKVDEQMPGQQNKEELSTSTTSRKGTTQAVEQPGNNKPAAQAKKQQQFAEDHLFTRRDSSETIYASAFERYEQRQGGVVNSALKGA
ncbi:unnamed protein product [Amoebophrya sp. A120]|nr:unnamed protein product [Amoebophrya sp. A120]|eukprot:GSA120T00022174001.1